jgi:hypothetical protein
VALCFYLHLRNILLDPRKPQPQPQTSKPQTPNPKPVIKVWRSAFVYTSFLNISLMSICFAGLMINFISGFVWSLMKKWMAGGQAGETLTPNP